MIDIVEEFKKFEFSTPYWSVIRSLLNRVPTHFCFLN